KILSWQGNIRHYSGEIPWLSPLAMFELFRVEKKLGRLANSIRPEAPWESPGALELDSITLETWKRRHLRSKGARLFLDLRTRAVLTSEPRDVSFLYFLSYLRWGQGLDRLISIPDGAQQDRFVGGAQQISQRMADELGDRLRLDTPVLAV